MRFTDRKTLFIDRIALLSIRSIRTDRHMAYTDRYGAGVLDNPRQNGHTFPYKKNVNAITRQYGQRPHFKIPYSRIPYNFTPLMRPLDRNLEN